MNLNRDRGVVFTRTMKALAVARGDASAAIPYALSQWPNEASAIVTSLKGVIAAQSTSDTGWVPTPAAVDMVDLVRPLTVLGRLTGLRKAPARTRLISATSGSTAFWAGEAQPRPISKMHFQGSTIEPLSVVAILVSTWELLTSSHPDAESLLSRDLANAVIAAMDSTMLDPGNAGVAGAKPASLTHGAYTIHSSGNSLASIDADLELLVQSMSDSNASDLRFPVWIMRARTWLYLKRMRGSGGALAFPGLTTVRDGGELVGFPVIVSNASPSDVGSPAEGGEIVLADPSAILVVDDGGAIDTTKHASIAMADTPTSPAQQVSLFQTYSAGLKMVRFVNWSVLHTGAVQVLDQVNY